MIYRKFQMGEIVEVTPQVNQFEVRVHIKLQYRKLLTPNSVFWSECGARIQLNGGGLTVQASPLSRILKGGSVLTTYLVPAPD